ncbi:GH92 family glycosyl hydrolase [Flammeovirga yaeyamensis]|uniref:GH92 family glycosyl hydrolase n=1 Tax=Flammeovirga yaeyamensis TaxID=367791 RepID=A0AAX1NB74_9BACT|nr:GH92 family glycosyl hydrolase [Flammeovirga yaeyamensis]MBB3699896.1 putative alpha-1,2-mannosidase [Flammeovirga yaeyamensis]NMF38308.1 glycoside hydrolase family 92 protein [Flammeovirga yaeyamensis]QWG04720.1 GH92 family glycosyl hydrolase [Flammeovirga yaeyamensis]
MRSLNLIWLSLAALLTACSTDNSKEELLDLTPYVSTQVGTLSDFKLSTGNTYPAVATPWGMNFWTPQTNENGDGWAYMYQKDSINGLKQTHQPSPWINDYAAFSIFPMVGEVKFKEKERQSKYSHETEIAKPHYYKVELESYNTTAEVTPTTRGAVFQFTFPKSSESIVLLDAYHKGSYVKVIPEENKIIGFAKNNSGGVPENFANYFVVQFDKSFTTQGTWNGKESSDALEVEAYRTAAYVKFDTKEGEVVTAKVASSFISPEQAQINLDREIGDKTFAQVFDAAKLEWNTEFNKLKVEGGSERSKQNFYTSMYRTLLFPRKFYEYDANNKLVHYSPYNGEVRDGYMFTDNGFWDTFRAVFPFFTVMYPEMDGQIMAGLVNTYEESGWLPEWASPGHRDCMIGSNSASLIADAYLKGIRGYDIEKLYEAIIKNSNQQGPLGSVGRMGADYYNDLGYIPYDVGIHENTARTLEYAYADFTISKLAEALGKPQSEIDLFKKRANNYKNVFDPSTNFMRAKMKDGSWQTPFIPEAWGGAFTEGSSWHYTWSVFHDPAGLADLMGGREAFAAKLDSVFSTPSIANHDYYGFEIHEITEMKVADEKYGTGQYAHGNQPIQHGIYLYDYVGQPWKAQKWTRKVMKDLYSPTPDGLCGDEDNGQTSAWFVFSALGMYPVAPGTGQYIIGSPEFEKASMKLENGNTFTVIANNNSEENVYIQSAKLNGKDFNLTYLTHDQIMAGGKIEFEMGPQPNKAWGSSVESAPYSMSREK